MTRDLLWRGMLAGAAAALLATLFARAFAEPQVDLAIAFEAAHSAMAHMPGMNEEPELVTRATQKGLGLLTAIGAYGAAVGGVFALVFAFAYGRLARTGPRSLALVMCILAFLVVALVPALKYPPTPPAVGQHETVALRTTAYFAMIGLSLLALAGAVVVHRRLPSRIGGARALLVGIAAYGLAVVLFQALLPTINEVPADFPATVLWNFRVAAIGVQLVLWAVIGVVFGDLAERLIRRS
jgi:hypothetical protein